MRNNSYREDLARRTQQNLVEMGCLPPPDAVKRTLTPEKKATIDLIEVEEIEVTDEEVLKYGRRLAMLLAADRKKRKG